MKRSIFILLAGMIAALVCYAVVYQFKVGPRRALLNVQSPELAWLQKEFNLSEAEFSRISDLHAKYLPQCAEMCRRIAASNAELSELLSKTNVVTSEIDRKLQETARLRAECQSNMLRHFYDVSKAMPPEQGQRYLSWVHHQTLASAHGMEAQHSHD